MRRYHAASPVISGKTVYVGAADSHLYALSLDRGKQRWKFKTNARIRATPLVDPEQVLSPIVRGAWFVPFPEQCLPLLKSVALYGLE